MTNSTCFQTPVCRIALTDEGYCTNCETVLGLPGFHLISVASSQELIVFEVETSSRPLLCPDCSVPAVGHGRLITEHIDAPCFGIPSRTRWYKRRLRCVNNSCSRVTFIETCAVISPPRHLLSVRARRWAIGRMRYDNASVASIARQLGCGWSTVWRSIKHELETADKDPTRFDGVTEIGVDEHVWHHRSRRYRGPRELTGMVDLTRDEQGKVRARLLDLVPGRSGPVYRQWLLRRGTKFRKGIKVASLDPFRGYKNAIDDTLEDAVSVVDHFHITKLGMTMIDDVRQRIQQETLGHRGHKKDPLYGIRRVLLARPENVSPRQLDRMTTALSENEHHEPVTLAWLCNHDLRLAMDATNRSEGKNRMIQLLDRLHTCPVPEIARLGRTLRKWRKELLAFFDTNGANNGGTEAINGLIELHRRIARGFRNLGNYRLRMLLIGGALDTTLTHTQR